MPVIRYKAHYPKREAYSVIVVHRHVQPSSRRFAVCHGCGDVFRPRFRNNARCEKCSRMQQVLFHQKMKKRAHEAGKTATPYLRQFLNHTCDECRWALKRGLKMERE